MATQDESGGKLAAIDEVSALKRTLAQLKRRLDDQNQRIEALARAREQGMATVGQLRAELALVAADRDRLRRQLIAIEGMQTETMTMDEHSIGDETAAGRRRMPSIDELLATFNGASGAQSASHSTVGLDDAASSGEYEEMISPDLIVLGSSRERASLPAERCLVQFEGSLTRKSTLDQDLLTIGRSESADIKIDGDYISRIHARILRIGTDCVLEDANSKNGTRVNGDLIERHVLKHGDVIRIGTANFRFVDPATAPPERD